MECGCVCHCKVSYFSYTFRQEQLLKPYCGYLHRFPVDLFILVEQGLFRNNAVFYRCFLKVDDFQPAIER